jgi:hypothetical protein
MDTQARGMHFEAGAASGSWKKKGIASPLQSSEGSTLIFAQ